MGQRGRRWNHDELGRELDSLHLMLDASVDCIKVINIDGTVRRMNLSGCMALGVPTDERDFGMKWLTLLPVDVRDRGRRALNAVRKGRKASFAGRSELPGEKPVHWDNILTPLFDQEGQLSAIMCVSRNVTRQREAEQKLIAASNIDALTRLPNRRFFVKHADKMLRRSHKLGEAVGILIMDIDHFKLVNDRHGHLVGDMVLRTLARHFRKILGPDDFVARLGGDEFVAIVPGDRDRLMQAAVSLRGVAPPVGGSRRTKVDVTLSIGGAMLSGDLADLSSLMRASDNALYAVKANGRDDIRLFDPQSDQITGPLP